MSQERKEKLKEDLIVALKEQDAYPAMPDDGYGWEKSFSERMCPHATEDLGPGTRVVHFHNVYRPDGTWDDGRNSDNNTLIRKYLDWNPGIRPRDGIEQTCALINDPSPAAQGALPAR